MHLDILVAGATGFIGRGLVAFLKGKGHNISALVRDVDAARNLLGGGITFLKWGLADQQLTEQMELVDVVINLAGRSIDGRWSRSRKKAFRDSRSGITQTLSDAISRSKSPPHLFISASAVGYYGDTGSKVISESQSVGDGYLATLCRDWENAATSARTNKTRVCVLRLGIVVGLDGGILQKLALPLQMGISPYVGSGSETLPWIHLIDVLEIINYCIDNSNVEGAVNCTAPLPVTGRQFAEAAGRISGAKFSVGIPKMVLWLRFGEGSSHLWASHYVLPRKLDRLGYKFRFSNVFDALNEELSDKFVSIERFDSRDVERSYPKEARDTVKRDKYVLVTEVELNGEPDKVFPFFSSPFNLGLLTPAWVNFQIVEMPRELGHGTSIKYKIGLWFMKFRWTSEIVSWKPGVSFVDNQIKGPYVLWRHEHNIIRTTQGYSKMTDRVTYKIPGWKFGQLIHKLMIKRVLINIFNYRRRMIKLLFQ